MNIVLIIGVGVYLLRMYLWIRLEIAQDIAAKIVK